MRLAIATRSPGEVRSATAASVRQLLRSNRLAIQLGPKGTNDAACHGRERNADEERGAGVGEGSEAALVGRLQRQLHGCEDGEPRTGLGGRGPRRHPAEQQESRRERGDQHLDRRDPRQHTECVDSADRNDDENHHAEGAECRTGIVQAGEKRSGESGEQRGGCAIGPAGQDPERTAGKHRKRCRRAGPQRKPMIAVRDGGCQCAGFESELKLVRIAAIGDRLAQQPAILHDIHKIAKPERKAGDRDVDPAGILIQRGVEAIERRAQRIGPLAIAAARFEPSRDPCADCGNAP